MITQRVNTYQAANVGHAVYMVEMWRTMGRRAWRHGLTVYWVEDSTD